MSSSLSSCDEYGFLRPPDFDYKCQEEFLGSYLSVLARRAKKWEDLLSNVGYPGLNKGSKLKRFIRKGVPSSHRKGVWMEVSGAASLRRKEPTLYTNMLAKVPSSPTTIGEIVADLPRTFPNNTYFDSTRPDNLQGEMYNVLLAFSNSNPSIGYCQGLNYIAGLLLLITKDEEAAFWLLKVLLEEKLPDYYTASMPGLLTDLKVMEALAKQEIPALCQHIDKLGVPWELFASKWFICLYSDVLPTETVLRIWDTVFYEGDKILFRVALGILKINQEQLLLKQDFSSLVDNLKTILVSKETVNCHTFLEEICERTGPLPRNKINRLRLEMGRVVKKEQEEREARRKDRGLQEG